MTDAHVKAHHCRVEMLNEKCPFYGQQVDMKISSMLLSMSMYIKCTLYKKQVADTKNYFSKNIIRCPQHPLGIRWKKKKKINISRWQHNHNDQQH